MKYFRIGTDYKNYISIDEDELPKAIQAFISGDSVVFKEGATRRIETITPDFTRMMGWNRGYEPNAEDWGLIGTDEKCAEARNLIPEMTEKLKLTIKTKQLHD